MKYNRIQQLTHGFPHWENIPSDLMFIVVKPDLTLNECYLINEYSFI